MASIRLLALLWMLVLGVHPGACAPATERSTSLEKFVPGEIWLDTKGKPINAHGGGMMYHNQTYYWYGENKVGRSWIPDANKSWDGYRVNVTGIRCYSSKDLYRWRARGLVLKAVPKDPSSDLHPSKVVERPKVAYNPRTGKFVMWMHIDTADYQSARAGVAVADSPTGPFQYLGSVKPEGADSRDQTLFVDDDGKAYRIYSSEWNKATYISLLTDDWLKHAGRYVRIFPGQSREAQAVFKRHGKYYMLSSECSGWDPNPMHAAVADSIWGPWRELGNPCLGRGANTTFQSQSTYVFPVVGKPDACILMADRWEKSNLPDSRYVWLPILFDGDSPRLKWLGEWDLSFFDRPTRAQVLERTNTPGQLGFSVQTNDDRIWLVWPDGTRFFSLGVCCVKTGASRDEFSRTNPSYAAWQHYTTTNEWASATARRLKAWGFTTIGGWSDFGAFTKAPEMDQAITPVLHIGSAAGAPWWNMWDPKITDRMEQVARDQILSLRDDPALLGYYSDNEMGWWPEALFRMALEQSRDSEQRKRLIELLHSTYPNWGALLKDFEVDGAGSWEELESGGKLYLRPGGNGLRTAHRFLGLMAERYYALVHELIRKYDARALILGDRYQSFFFPEVARACGRYVDAASSNLNASWRDGTFPRFYLDTLHALTQKPILTSEFYMASSQNRSGDRNSQGVFPTTSSQRARAAGFETTLRSLLKLPYVVGADWFQYYDEPPFGRFDGEDYNFGLVDIHDRPYSQLIKAASRLQLAELKSPLDAPESNALHGVPRAPRDPMGQFRPGLALLRWDRARGFVKPDSEMPLADLFLAWTPKALYAGLYAQDVVEPHFYRNKQVPEEDRAEWTFTIPGSGAAIRCRIGAGLEPHVTGAPVRIVNSSGVNLDVRNISALELPARLFGRERFRAGDTVELKSVLVSYCRIYRTEWSGNFPLAQVN